MKRWFGRSAGILHLIIAVVLAVVPSGVASAKVFASQNQALAEAFPDATRIERQTVLLRRGDAAKIAAIIGVDVAAKVVVLHRAYREDELLGYAHIDVHNVRSKPEAILIVLTSTGAVRSVRVLAFHEPLDYLPTERWYSQFVGKTKQDGLRVGRDVHGVVGATLSARAAADGVRRMLAYWEVLLRPTELETQSP
jgi:Na+-translocating ferredoxin:NAD+ oxidoreductase RnfG subunit